MGTNNTRANCACYGEMMPEIHGMIDANAYHSSRATWPLELTYVQKDGGLKSLKEIVKEKFPDNNQGKHTIEMGNFLVDINTEMYNQNQKIVEVWDGKIADDKHRKDIPSLIIAKTMDMEFAHLGGYKGETISSLPRAFQVWGKQINDTESTAASNPLRFFPLFSYDPRRYGLPNDSLSPQNVCKPWDEPFARIVGCEDSATANKSPKIWLGFCMNPALGFRPFDEFCAHLADFYEKCEKDEIPILAHCAPSGITVHDPLSYKVFDIFKEEERKKLKGQNAHCSNMYHGMESIFENRSLDYFYRNYGHPRNWIPVLQRFPKLRLCLAGFGGNIEWGHKSMIAWAKNDKNYELPPREWIRCIIELTRYENVYADISGLDFTDPYIQPVLLKLLSLIQDDKNDKFKHLKYKLIFGSDWYLTHMMEMNKNMNNIGDSYINYCETFMMRFFSDVDMSGCLWERVSLINPWNFYGLSEKKVKSMSDELANRANGDAYSDMRKKMEPVLKELAKYVSHRNQECPVVKPLAPDKNNKDLEPSGELLGLDVGDEGKVVLEINIRLSGFGGLLPDSKFTPLTKKSVEQFQRDYMGKNLTGVVDRETLKAIDDFTNNKEYHFDFNETKCPCTTSKYTAIKNNPLCDGFGNMRTLPDKYGNPGFEYLGIHRSLLFILKALLCYLKKTRSIFTLNKIDSGYRCWTDNNDASRHDDGKTKKTTNHMGCALDLHFNKKNEKNQKEERTKNSVDMDYIRKEFFCKYMGAPERGTGQEFGWKQNHVGLEPKIFNDGTKGADTWVHVDIREFDNEYKDLKFFVKNETDMNGKSIKEMANG